jgi:hypothetical protein
MDSPATYGSGWTNNGKIGKALSFDGVNDYVMVPDNDALTSKSISLSFWYTLTADPNCDGLFNNWRSLIRKSLQLSVSTTGWDVLLEEVYLSAFPFHTRINTQSGARDRDVWREEKPSKSAPQKAP